MESVAIWWLKLLVKVGMKGKPPSGKPHRVVGLAGIGPALKVDPWKLAHALKKAGCNSLGFGLYAEAYFDEATQPEKLKQNVVDRAEEWARACWANGLYFVAQITNANDLNKRQVTRVWDNTPEAWGEFTKQLASRLGTRGILFEPCLEDEDEHQRVVGAIASAWPGPPKIYNRGSRPKTLPGGWDYLDTHPHRTTESWPLGHNVIVQTDSPIGQQLRGGAKPREFNPQQVGDYARKVLASGVGFLHFGFDTENTRNLIDCVKAIGRALR